VTGLGKDESPSTQHVFLRGKLRPATVHVVNAPKDGQIFCSGIAAMSAATQEVELPTPDFARQCEFVSTEGNIKSSVKLLAGAPNTVTWPGGG
jgi:hypothetical protein